jgi:hypothetical protein
MAPEMLKNDPHNHTLDVWCVGILLFELVHGSAPFTVNRNIFYFDFREAILEKLDRKL